MRAARCRKRCGPPRAHPHALPAGGVHPLRASPLCSFLCLGAESWAAAPSTALLTKPHMRRGSLAALGPSSLSPAPAPPRPAPQPAKDGPVKGRWTAVLSQENETALFAADLVRADEQARRPHACAHPLASGRYPGRQER